MTVTTNTPAQSKSARQRWIEYRMTCPDPRHIDREWEAQMRREMDAEAKADGSWHLARAAELERWISEKEAEIEKYPTCPRREDSIRAVAEWKVEAPNLRAEGEAIRAARQMAEAA